MSKQPFPITIMSFNKGLTVGHWKTKGRVISEGYAFFNYSYYMNSCFLGYHSCVRNLNSQYMVKLAQYLYKTTHW